VPVHEGRVLDQSLGGYRMAWAQASQIRARVGELVGMTLAERGRTAPDWMLGVVRWLRYEDDGGLSAASSWSRAAPRRLACACTARMASPANRARGRDRGAGRTPTNPVPRAQQHGHRRARIEWCVTWPSRGLRESPPVEEILAGINLLLNAGDYALLRPLRADQVEPQAVNGEHVSEPGQRARRATADGADRQGRGRRRPPDRRAVDDQHRHRRRRGHGEAGRGAVARRLRAGARHRQQRRVGGGGAADRREAVA
jgi:hypothetical protein